MGDIPHMDKLDDIHDNDEHWYTPAEYERTYGVPATSLKDGLTNGTLYAPMFYNGQPYTRHALVKMWQTPVRSGTFAAGDGRWPMKIQFLCDRFLQYIAAATILTATTDEQRQELREAEARIIKALEHVIHRTLTTTEAEHAITTLLVHFNAMLPAGPKDAVKDNSRGHPFKQSLRVASTPRVNQRDFSSSLITQEVNEQAYNRISNKERRFKIAKRGLQAYFDDRAPVGYPGHPLSKLHELLPSGTIRIGPPPSIATIRELRVPRPSGDTDYQRQIAPEHYVIWCLESGWSPRTEQRQNPLSRDEILAYMPLIFGHSDGDREWWMMEYYGARRIARIGWLRQAVESLSDLEFWDFNDKVDAEVIGRAMRTLWRKEYNPYGRLTFALDKHE